MDMHQYNTRNKTALNVARVKTKVAENSLKKNKYNKILPPKLLMTHQKLYLIKYFLIAFRVLLIMSSSIIFLYTLMIVPLEIVMYVTVISNKRICLS